MNSEIADLKKDFIFLNDAGAEIIESFCDEDNFGNICILYKLDELLIQVTMDRSQYFISFRLSYDSEMEIDLLFILRELRLADVPDDLYIRGAELDFMSKQLRHNLSVILKSVPFMLKGQKPSQM